jgi:hypothetical protein
MNRNICERLSCFYTTYFALRRQGTKILCHDFRYPVGIMILFLSFPWANSSFVIPRDSTMVKRSYPQPFLLKFLSTVTFLFYEIHLFPPPPTHTHTHTSFATHRLRTSALAHWFSSFWSVKSVVDSLRTNTLFAPCCRHSVRLIFCHCNCCWHAWTYKYHNSKHYP